MRRLFAAGLLISLYNSIKQAVLSFPRRDCVRMLKSGHSREGGNPELFNIPGFRVALRLPGMTKK